MNKNNKILGLTLVASSLLLSTAANASTSLNLGTPGSFLDQLDLKQAQQSFKQTDKAFSLVNPLGDSIEVIADNFALEKDGTLSMSGKVKGNEQSKFILQGNDDKVYGWVILSDQDKAFEYTTKDGSLVVEEIKVTDVRPICDFERHDHAAFSGTHTEHSHLNASGAAPHIGSYNGEDVSDLQSKPGSDYVILLDTSKIMNGNTPRDRTPENLWITWQIVAASFSMFDVNVTTNRAVYDQAAPSKRGGGTLYTQSGRSSCHFAFGTSTFCTLYKEDDAYGQGRIAAHEYGHLFHLSHDGGAPGGEYHNGLADFQWVPVMGNIWYGTSWENALYQWSKGEYSGASNREDDFNILTGFIPYKSDDNTVSKALNIATNGSVSANSNYGQIERNTDSDHFTFTVGASGGSANLTIDRIEHIGGGMLDVQAYLRDGNGNVVAQSNKSVNRSATINTNLSSGTYTLEITGGAEGTPSNGFSKYSSLGYYGIEGTVTGTDGGTDIEVPGTPAGLQASNITNDSFTASWNSVQWATSYELQRSTDSQSTWQDAGSSTSTSKTIGGLTSKDQWIRVKASNSKGSSAYSNAVYVQLTDVVELPVTPTGLNATNITTDSFTLNWGAVDGASQYDVQLWNDIARVWEGAGSSTTTSKALNGLTAQDQWTRVRATNSAGSSSYSDYIYVQLESNGCSGAPAVPSGLSGSSWQISWNSVTGASKYDVQYWTRSGWADHGSSTTNSYTLGLNGTQYVRVRAGNSCGNSSYSNWIRVN